jgi:DNA mismatch repair ATPase MutS
MKIYWKIKANYMNCIIFVQLGKSEFLAFENDAIKLHEIFKKPLNKFSIFLMVNFWNK